MDTELKSALIRVLPFIGIIALMFILKKRGKVQSEDFLLQKPTKISTAIFIVLGFIMFAVITEYLLFGSGLVNINPWRHELLISIIRITGAVILAPIAEELVFRGILLSKLNKKLNIHVAIFVQAISFVLSHSFTYENTLESNVGICQVFVDACLYGYARYYTKSIYTPMAMHIGSNLMATLERFLLV
ncbi:CPBP family intramembrane glutamic endopeptidase [Pedobacter boryungensis]|uniref:CPBP family intramembrane metalloprotease n=1 Tax=Pedobacter boryungensis TaxID=869962 RepID=A0ABX2DGL1_9SPHI|nr:CPBP family intramembrane glutamic endopeptidase [Pedobacter boryungensis]NQX33075.1 CPBP family intramembrane metalloprotease [Pedobacter boryungensis]